MSETPRDQDEPEQTASQVDRGPEQQHEDVGTTGEIEPASEKTPKLPGTAEHPEPHIYEVAGAD
jgi:hypothetical protein